MHLSQIQKDARKRTLRPLCCSTALAKRRLETRHKSVNRWMKPFTIHTAELPAAAKAARPIPTYSHGPVSGMDGYRKKGKVEKTVDKEGGTANVYMYLLTLQKNKLKTVEMSGSGERTQRPLRSDRTSVSSHPTCPHSHRPPPRAQRSRVLEPPGHRGPCAPVRLSRGRTPARRSSRPAAAGAARLHSCLGGRKGGGLPRGEGAAREGACTSRLRGTRPRRQARRDTARGRLLPDRRLRARLPGPGSGRERGPDRGPRPGGGRGGGSGERGLPGGGGTGRLRRKRGRRQGAPAGGARAPGPKGRCLPRARKPRPHADNASSDWAAPIRRRGGASVVASG